MWPLPIELPTVLAPLTKSAGFPGVQGTRDEQAGGGTGGGRNGTETSIIWVPGSLIALG